MIAGMDVEAARQSVANVETWRRFSLVQAHLASYLARELTRATGMSEADFQILDALLDAPEHRQRALDLRWVLQWEKSRLSHQVGRMVGRGLLERQTCPEDARSAYIALTPAGRESARQARRIRTQSLHEMVFDTLGPQRLADLNAVTALLAERLTEAAPDDPQCQAARDIIAAGVHDNASNKETR